MLANAVNMPQMPKTPTYYWIDALCVDQSNITERNAQVARMADVFKKADGVVVWLGKEDDFTNDALTTMRRISAIPEKDWPLIPYTSFYKPEESQSGYRSHLTYHNWLGFMALVSEFTAVETCPLVLTLQSDRPWFKRAWVG
jgi:hypothetical protein